MQYLFTPPNKRRSFCGAQIRTLHRKKTGHTFFVCPTSKVLASQCLNLMTLVTNSLPFQISNIICFQQFYIQWLIVVSSYLEQSQILQVLLPQAEEEYKQTSGSYLPSSPLSLLHPFLPVLPAAPLFPL